MNEQILALTALFAPLAFMGTAAFSWWQPGLRPLLIKRMSIIASVISICTATACGVMVSNDGLIESALVGVSGMGFSLRLDALSVLMFSMISLLSFVVIRFSHNYLDGDSRQGTFMGRLAAAIASVQLLVLSGNLGLFFIAWVFTSISLHRLLVFYGERPGAIIAARKKFIMARLGDLALLIAIICLFVQFGSGNLEVIFQAIKSNVVAGRQVTGMETIAIFLALAALLKSAQFPTHGWLIEVMETPTPVSALLHVGLLNAGPFLILRMAFVIESSIYAPLILIAIGAFTALFASIVFMTQTSVKTTLAYSSVAHMGFSFLVCGLGVYPAAMLHLVAHSFYKAHAFLSSGSVIESIRSAKVKAAERIGSPIRIVFGILMALLVYGGFALAWGIDPVEELSLLIIGGVIVLGLSHLFASAIDSTGGIKLVVRAFILTILVATAFFVLESSTHQLLATQFPELARLDFLEMFFAGVILLTFSAVVFIQICEPMFQHRPFYQALAVHFRNGLYANTVLDRMVRTLYTQGNERMPELKKTKASTSKNNWASIPRRFEEQPA